MKENERWSGHVLYFTVVSALAAGAIAGCAALWADPSKIPGAPARWSIVGSLVFASAALILAVYGSTQLSNYLVNYNDLNNAKRLLKGQRVTKAAGLAYFVLIVGLFLLALAFVFAALSTQGSADGVIDEKVILDSIKELSLASRTTTLTAEAARGVAESAERTISSLKGEWREQIDDLRGHLKVLEDGSVRANVRILLKSDWRQIQKSVGAKLDGLKGPETCRKIREWQGAHGLSDTGVLSSEQIDELIGAAPHAELRLDVKPCGPERAVSANRFRRP